MSMSFAGLLLTGFGTTILPTLLAGALTAALVLGPF